MIRALILLLICTPAWAATFYAAPGGGAAATCVDSGANVCTVARCISVAANTDTCSIAPGTYPGSELGGSGYVIETAEFVNLTCSGDVGSCIFRPTGTNVSGIRLNSPVAGGTITVTGIKIDGSLATPLDQCFYLNDSTLLYTVTLTDTTCAEADIYDVRALANEITLTMTRNNFTASTAVSPRSYVGMVGAWAEGGVSIDTGTITLAKYDDTATPIVNIAATAASMTASVKNLTITVANDSATTTGYIDGILVTNIPNAVITGNTITATGFLGTRQLRAIRCYSTAALDSSNCKIANNSVITDAGNGQMFAVGYDQTGLGDTYSGNGIITDNYALCKTASTPVHGVGFFWSSGGFARGNKIVGCGIGLLSKDQPAGAVYVGNIVVNAWQEYAYAKGTTGPAFYNNTFILKNTDGEPLTVGVDGAANSTNVIFTNNLIYSPGRICPTNMVNTASSQTIASATNNLWYGCNSYQWTYLGSTYSTLSAWNAVGAVGTDISSNPKISDDGNYRLRQDSGAARAGYQVGAYNDNRGCAYLTPPSIGAIEFCGQ